MPLPVRARMRSASNSAAMPSTLNSSQITGSVGSVDRAAEVQRHALPGQFVPDVTRRAVTGESIELGHDEGVALPHGGECFPEPRPVGGSNGRAIVNRCRRDRPRLFMNVCRRVSREKLIGQRGARWDPTEGFARVPS